MCVKLTLCGRLMPQVRSILGPKRKKDQERFEQREDRKQKKKVKKEAEKKTEKDSKTTAGAEGTKDEARRDSGAPRERKQKPKEGKGKAKPSKADPVTAADEIADPKKEKPDAGDSKIELDRSSRLSSYAVPRLAKPSSSSGGGQSKADQKKRKAETKPPEPNESGGLTKAQKKNMKRSAMRAAKRVKTEEA